MPERHTLRSGRPKPANVAYCSITRQPWLVGGRRSRHGTSVAMPGTEAKPSAGCRWMRLRPAGDGRNRANEWPRLPIVRTLTATRSASPRERRSDIPYAPNSRRLASAGALARCWRARRTSSSALTSPGLMDDGDQPRHGPSRGSVPRQLGGYRRSARRRDACGGVAVRPSTSTPPRRRLSVGRLGATPRQHASP